MLMRAHLFGSSNRQIGVADVPEQIKIVIYGGSIFVRDDDCVGFHRVDHLFFDRIDPDTICVVKYLDHEREAA